MSLTQQPSLPLPLPLPLPRQLLFPARMNLKAQALLDRRGLRWPLVFALHFVSTPQEWDSVPLVQEFACRDLKRLQVRSVQAHAWLHCKAGLLPPRPVSACAEKLHQLKPRISRGCHSHHWRSHYTPQKMAGALKPPAQQTCHLSPPQFALVNRRLEASQHHQRPLLNFEVKWISEFC